MFGRYALAPVCRDASPRSQCPLAGMPCGRPRGVLCNAQCVQRSQCGFALAVARSDVRHTPRDLHTPHIHHTPHPHHIHSSHTFIHPGPSTHPTHGTHTYLTHHKDYTHTTHSHTPHIHHTPHPHHTTSTHHTHSSTTRHPCLRIRKSGMVCSL